jgi:hypothetical protein
MYMKFVLHRKHTYVSLPSAAGIALASVISNADAEEV